MINAGRRIAALWALIALIVAGCGGESGQPSPQHVTLTVYSANGLGGWYAKQFEKFTADTGIKVDLFEAGSGEVASRVNSPAVWERPGDAGSVAPADLLVTLPPFIQKAQKAGLLQPSGADTSGIPAESIGPQGSFVPIVNTALCFIANPAVQPVPSTWNDLLQPALKGKLQYSTPGEAGDGTALLLLLQHQMGKQGALDYLARLKVNNVGPSPSTAKLQPKVNSGELLVANGDVQMNLSAINNDGAKFAIFFPAMPGKGRTTVFLPYMAGVTASSQYPEEAKRLLAFLLSDDVQKTVSANAFGIPARPSVSAEPNAILQGVTLWAPDWDRVLAELEDDIAAYQKAVS